MTPYSAAGAKLVDGGYSAIPALPGSKRPGNFSMGEWWGDFSWNRFCDRLPTEIETSHWDRWPDAGVCMALDHTIKVIDIDTDDDEIRAAVLSALPVPTVMKRGQKGFSIFYRGSADIVSRPFDIVPPGGKRMRAVDLLAHGKQTVLPPTIHPDTGRPYEWLTDETLFDTAPDQLPELPDDVAARIESALAPFGFEDTNTGPRAPGSGDSTWRDINDAALANLDAWVPGLGLPKTKRSRDGRYRAVAAWRDVDNANLAFHRDGIKDWGGGESYTPLDVTMRAHGADLDQAARWLRDQLGIKPTPLIDVSRLIASAERKRLAAAPLQPAPTPAPTAIRAPRGAVDPFTPAAAGGLMEAYANWYLDTARRPVPEFAVLSAASFVATMFSRRAVGPTGSGLNMYLVCLGRTGFGKEHVHKTLHTLAHDAGFHYLIGPGEVTSGTAIEKVVRRRPFYVMPWDEVGIVLQGVNGNNAASWSKSIRKVLLELYSKSTSVWTGKEHADPTRDNSAEPIHCPTVGILGVSTPETFYSGLSDESFRDGFLARLIVVDATVKPPRGNPPALLITPASLITAVKKTADAFPWPPGNLPAIKWKSALARPSLVTVPWESNEAESQWLTIEDWQAEQVEEHGAQDGIIGRAAENTIKLATVRAISRNPANARVTTADLDWGYAVVQRSLDSLDAGAGAHVAGSPFEELCKAILRALRATKEAGLPRSVLLRARGVSKANDRDVKAALDRLVELGEIYAPSIGGRGVKVRLREPANTATGRQRQLQILL